MMRIHTKLGLPARLATAALALALLPLTAAHAQAPLRQIEGRLLEQFAPATLAGHPLVDPMTGRVAGARRLVQPGGVEAAYGLEGGAYANLSFGNTYGRTPYIIEACEEWEPIGAHRACVSTATERVSLRWAFSQRVMVTLAAPDRATAVRLARALPLDEIAAFVARTPGTALGQ